MMVSLASALPHLPWKRRADPPPSSPAILSELSAKTRTAFSVALLGNWTDQPNNGRLPEFESAMGWNGGGSSTGVNYQLVQQDVATLQGTLHGSTDVQLLSVTRPHLFSARPR